MTTGPPLMVMVSGARSQIGKSTVSLAILMALLHQGMYTAADLAYIKPATQCRSVQLIRKWCHTNGVACADVGPVVYRPGFSYDVIDGTTSPAALLQSVRDAVLRIAAGKRFVLVDGVGYPAVGSCTGTSNADIARALSIPVLFVAPPGVGDPIDSINMAAVFFQSYGVHVMGAVVNRIRLEPDARHSPENCDRYVRKYFRDHRPEMSLYGFLPELTSTPAATSCQVKGTRDVLTMNDFDCETVRCIAQELVSRVDIGDLLDDLRALNPA